MRPINDSLYDLLMAQGISAGRPASPKRKGAERSANRKASRIKRLGAAKNGAAQQLTEYPAGGLDIPMGRLEGDRRPILCWVNPTFTRKRAGGTTPLLVIV